MRLLHVFVQPRGGGGSVALTLATIDLARSRGHDVESFTRRSGDYPGNFAGRLNAARSAFHAPESEKAFTEVLRSFKPDLVHANELFPYISPRILQISRSMGIPVVMNCDDYHLTCPVRNHFRNGGICTKCLGGREYWAIWHNCRRNLPESVVTAAYNFVVRKRKRISAHVDHFIACSEFSRQWLIEHAGIPGADITSISPAIDIPPSPSDAGAGQYAAFSGRFVPEKGIDDFLAAAAVSGVPAKLSRNARHFVKVDLPPTADIVVTTARSELDEFYRNARMLVFPSRWFETYGIVGAEAMSHGVPVVAARLGALEQLVDDGIDGLLYEPGNIDELAAKMKLLWDAPELARRLGKAGRVKVEKQFSRERNYASTMSVYEATIEKVRRRNARRGTRV